MGAMTKKSRISDHDADMFRELVEGITPLKQDKIQLKASSSKQKPTELQQQQNSSKQASAEFHFSDGFEAHFEQQHTLKYVKPGADSHEVKRLRRGEYPPELILDLHGYKRQDAKLEIAALIHEAQKRHHHCVCIVHGLGNMILKKAVPSWLVQHPAILGFHQAPLEWGGNGAILVLIELPREHSKF